MTIVVSFFTDAKVGAQSKSRGSRGAWDEMEEVVMAKDTGGARQMMLRGKLLLLKSGVKVRILDLAWTSYKIRILDGAHAGESGWVTHEAVQR